MLGGKRRKRDLLKKRRGQDGDEMAVKIRLIRMGKKKQPVYRVVVADGRTPRTAGT